MNPLWRSAAFCFPCRSSRAVRADLYTSSLVKQFTSSPRPYSISATPFRRKQYGTLDSRSLRLTNAITTRASIYQWSTRTFATQRIPSRFEDVPEDYEDAKGLPFRSNPLTQKEATTIFGRGIDAKSANRILRILHGRRVAGTLADPSLSAKISGVDRRISTIALTWLRSNVPVDENLCAGQRAEIELAEMEAGVLADGQRMGLYRLDAHKTEDKTKTSKGAKDSVYGLSGLDAIRQAKERERDLLEAKKKEAEERSAQNTGGLMANDGVGSQVELRRPGEHPWLKYYLERANVLPDVPPEMSIWQRLWPSAVVVLCVVGASLAFAQVYVPPSNSARLWPDTPPAAATITAIIAANTVIYVLWHVPPAFRMLNKYFLSVPGYPRALAVLGNVFSHQSITHFGINMTVLWFLGTRLHDDIGRGNFLALYFSSGVLSSFVSLAAFTIRNIFIVSSLGASGAISGVIAAYLWLHSDELFRPFLVPAEYFKGVPGYIGLAAVIGLDIGGLLRGWKFGARYDHYSHLGGYATGIVGAQMLKPQYREQRELRRKRNSQRWPPINDKVKPPWIPEPRSRGNRDN